MKPSWNFAKTGLGDGMNTCSQPSGYIERHLIHACRAQMDAISPSPDDEDIEGLLPNINADKSEALRQVQGVRKDLQHRHEKRRLRREHQNAGIRRTSTGTRVKQGDLV